MKEEIWKWNVNLAWELFTSAVYSYRKSLHSKYKHQRHMYYKNGLLSAVTSVEAYVNYYLLTEEKWSNRKLKKKSINDKLIFLGVNESIYSPSKELRNNFIIHHKNKDHRYYEKINELSLLNAIESAQEIIALINFNKKRIFPYWITGVNFINPLHNNDISLASDYEFWKHLKWLGCLTQDMYDLSGGFVYKIDDYNEYKDLYFGLWNKIKEERFKFKFMKNKTFPNMPVLSCDFWD